MAKFVLTPDMIENDEVRASLDFSKQKRIPVGTAQNRQLHVWHTCSVCNRGKYIPQTLARRRKSSYCIDCKNKHTNCGRPKGKGWFITGGYKVIDAERFYPEQKEYIKKHLTPHNGKSMKNKRQCWYKEHRVVALLHFGPELVGPRVPVRHLDGDKLNNDLSNLMPGTTKDNRMDHRDALIEASKWRLMALTLLRIIINARKFEH